MVNMYASNTQPMKNIYCKRRVNAALFRGSYFTFGVKSLNPATLRHMYREIMFRQPTVNVHKNYLHGCLRSATVLASYFL